jgi:CubicO group peptidase (beta-lactamase class C family)
MSGLQDDLTAAVERHRVPGAAIAIRDGDDIVEVVAGTADVRTNQPVTPATRFRIASITKLFTTTLVMQLVDDGAVDLDAPVRAHLPDLRLRDDPDVADTVTVRHLLTHTSGIPGGWFPDCGPDDDYLERFVPTLAQVDRLCRTGTLYSYGNSGFLLLGRIIQSCTGLTWEDALRERISEPLGLAHTAPVAAGEHGEGIAVSHMPDPATGQPRAAEMWPEYRTPAPAGSTLASTVSDLLRFAGTHRDIVSSDSARAMHTATVEQPTGVAVGLGWMMHDVERRTAGHGGGFSNMLRMSLDQDVAVAFLSNAPAGMFVYREVVAPLFERRVGATPIAQPIAAPDQVVADVDRYTGTYRHAGQTIAVTGVDGALHLNGARVQPTDRADVFVAGPAGAQTLAIFLTSPEFGDAIGFLHAGGLAYRRGAG